jgi:HPt (histidine-containing phosphotransfer) domain-containing protein
MNGEDDPPVHLDALERRLGGDRKAALAVLAAFSRDAPDQLARLSTAVNAGAHDEVRILAHTLKGGLLWIGADRAAASAHALELDPSGPGAALARLTADLETVLLALKSSSATAAASD